MSGVLDRPRFAEGQILAAADLEASQGHATNQLARHERGLHMWGIASGLALTGVDRTATGGARYQDITLSMGMAIDGTGREIVVPADQRLPEAAFEQSNVAQRAAADAWFPVYLRGGDVNSAAAPLGSYCGAASGGRTQEGFSISFGAPGDAAKLDEQTVPAAGEGPGNQAWKVLLGFVQWTDGIAGGKFTATQAHDDQGTSVRYAGVQADQLSARGSQMLLTMLAGDKGEGKFVFAVRKGSGPPVTVLTIAANGDLTATGKIQSGATPGDGPAGTKAQSGVARDGLILPLPPDVTEDMIAPGKGRLHVHLTPRIQKFPLGQTTGVWVGVPIACQVDSSRRLLCTVRYFPLAGGASQDAPGVVDYLLIAEIIPKGAQT
jgi:hypothetical protein